MQQVEPATRTTQPIVTGTSVLAIRYADGVMMMSDTLGSYGSMARYEDIERITKINDKCILGGGGEYSDFQFINKFLEELMVEDFCEDDGAVLDAREVHSYLARVMYNRRCKVNPLYNQLLVGGLNGDKPYLGYVDLYGSSFTENVMATGYGVYMAVPLLRKHWKEGMTAEEAKELLENCMRVLFYRECRTINKYRIAKISSEGVDISEPYSLKTEWSYDRFVDPNFQEVRA